MFEIAICDDDTIFSLEFQKLLEKVLTSKNLSFRLSLFPDISSFRHAIHNGKIYDLVFLDILFSTNNEEGIRFAKSLHSMKYKIDIIFITTNPEYALSGYDAFPLHFLVKPVSTKKLELALERFLEKHTPHSLHIVTQKKIIHIAVSDILFIEIYGHTIIIHKKDNQKEFYTGTLKELESNLMPYSFIRPHRSYLVNLEHIIEIKRYEITLTSGITIPISKNLYPKVQDSLIEYADKKCFLS